MLKKSLLKSNQNQLVAILLGYSLIALLLLITGVPVLYAQSPQPGTNTSPLATPTVPATITPVVVELRQPPQPAQSFWEQYGIIALLVSGIIGGLLTLIFQKVLGPTFAEWGQQLNEWRKGAAGRFREKYIPALAEEHRSLKLVGVHSGEGGLSPPRLKEVYVTLQMDSAKESEVALTQALTIEQIFSRQPFLVILGDPGAGKSTLLDYLTLVFCGDIPAAPLTRQGRLFPIYLLLRNCIADNRPLAELMADPDFLPLDFSPPEKFFQQQLEKGSCLVLLDGLDEVIDENQRDQVADKINQLVRTYPNNRYVVTCRTAGWHQDFLTGDFITLYIRRFSDDDIKRFAAGWYRAVRTQKVRARLDLSDEGQKRALLEAERGAAHEAQQLTTTLFANASLYRLARNPLILSLIALVHYRRTRLPQGRAKLYKECLEILLDVWDSRDKDIQISGPSYNAKETILREIAYYFHTGKITEAGREALEAIIEPLIPQLNCPIGPAETLKQIEERSGILVSRAIGRYVFAHRTLQEYLTATKLAADPQKLFSLGPHLRDEPWREVILLYAGLIEDAGELVNFILAQPDDADFNLLILAGQCLAEDVRVEDTSIKPKVLKQLEATFAQPETAQAPLRFRRLGESLAAIGGEDVLAFFAALLATGEPRQRIAAAGALGQAGQSSNPAGAVAHLLPHLTASDDTNVIRAICLALADLGLADEAALTALERVRQEGDESVRRSALWALLELGQAERFGLVKIPAGEFLMGSDPKIDKDAQGDEQPQHPLYLPDYYIAGTPVTNAQYAAFVQATGHRAPYQSAEWAKPYNWTKQAPPRGKENHPVVLVSWDDAVAYCRWLGAALPTEAEWEKAAGGADGWIYPWGNEWDAGRCNTSEGGKKGTTPVGSYPDGASPYDCLDMAGNVWEWCATQYAAEFKPYPYDAGEDEWTEEYLNRTNVLRVLRGGSWYFTQHYARCAYRYNWYNPTYRDYLVGFRVVVSFISHPSAL